MKQRAQQAREWLFCKLLLWRAKQSRRCNRGLSFDNKAFALPVVLVLSLVLLTLGLSVLQVTSSVSRTLADQNWSRLAKEAAQAGVVYTTSCIKQVASINASTWAGLNPGTKCDGTTNGASSYYAESASGELPKWRAKFAVGSITTPTDGKPRIKVTGILELLSDTSIVTKTYTSDSQVLVNVVNAGGGTAAKKVARGGSLTGPTCVLASDNQVYCAGSNQYGQLGNVDAGASSGTPVKFNIGTKSAKDVAVGSNYTCVLASDNQVYCAGYNGSGQLGDGTTTNRSTPVRFQLPGTTPAKQILTGSNAVCVLTVYKNLYCAGYNSTGRFGIGTANAAQTTPLPFSSCSSSCASAPPATTYGGLAVEQASIGQENICTRTSVFYCAGQNNVGQVPVSRYAAGANVLLASDNYSVSPNYNAADIALPQNTTAVTAPFACGINGGSLLCWGNAAASSGSNAGTRLYSCSGLVPPGSCGTGSYINPPYASPLTLQKVMVAQGFTCVQTGFSKGSPTGNPTTEIPSALPALYCAGQNTKGQLGNGTTTTPTASPVPKFNMPGAVDDFMIGALDGAYPYICALNFDGELYCAGDNFYGQLGNGGAGTTSSTPVEFDVGAKTVQQFISSGYNVCAVASDSQVYCAGDNRYGQLGDPNAGAKSNTPVKFKLPS